MPILVTNIRSGLGEAEEVILEKAMQRLGVKRSAVKEAAVSKTAVDARRGRVSLVSSVLLRLEGDEEKQAARAADPQITYRREEPLSLSRGMERLSAPIVVAGFGPAGMFAGLLLSEQGYPVVILERGSRVEKRTESVGRFWSGGPLNPECNVQFGEGGAGTFSDGKLTTRIGDPRCGYVLKRFVEFGAPEEILVKAKPHVGTDHLKGIVRSIRERILKNGGQIRFDCRLEEICEEGNSLRLRLADGEELEAAALILAVGHSARDTFEMLAQKGFYLTPKPFSVGVRVEHLQTEVDRALYHELAGHPLLPKGEYQLSYRQGERAVYTFCMCPGGLVVPSASEPDAVVVNGMSEYARDQKNANAALVVSVGPQDYGAAPLDGMAFQRRLERAAFQMGGSDYSAPVMTVGRYLSGKTGYDFGRVQPSYQIGICPGDFDALFPAQVNRMLREGLLRFGKKQKGFDAPDVVLTGVETRTSSPVRIERDERFQAVSHPNVYPCGEGAGYAGGIMSAAVDGIRVAQAVMERFCPGE